jgi:hypothetical protein
LGCVAGLVESQSREESTVRTSTVVLMAAMLAPFSALAMDEVLQEAVGFALTGSDNAKVEVIDGTNCVFQIGKEIFHLNNVDVDRLKWQGYKRTSSFYNQTEYWYTIELHGEDIVYEDTTVTILADQSPDLADAMRAKGMQTVWGPTKSREHTLTLYTAEGDRLIRAWQYVYSHGCTGRKSPF